MGRKSKKKKVLPSGKPTTAKQAESVEKKSIPMRCLFNTCQRCQERFCTIHLRQRWQLIGLPRWRRDHCFQCGGLEMGRSTGQMTDREFELFFTELLKLGKKKQLNKRSKAFLEHFFKRQEEQKKASIKIEAESSE